MAQFMLGLILKGRREFLMETRESLSCKTLTFGSFLLHLVIKIF